MTIGSLSEMNVKFLKDHKDLGYTTMTRLIDDAITAFRKKMEAKLRHEKLMQAAGEYREDHAWEDLDGEDYVE